MSESEQQPTVTKRLLGWDKSDTPGDKTQHGVVAVSYLLIFGMFLCSVLLGLSVPDDSDVSRLGVGLTAFLLFGAAAAIGASLGFLFGLPRSRYADQLGPNQPTAQQGANSAATNTSKSAHYLTNSNLIKVSDWLTTIIIGVGLVNLVKLAPAARELSNTLEQALGGADYAGIIGVSVIVIALLAAVILCYLWTSVRVRELLEQSEDHLGDGVPSLIGLTVGDAKTVLGETILEVEPDDATDDDTIASQEPAPGAPAAVGSGVAVKADTSESDPVPPDPE